jgi:hypothetical protein
MEGELLDKIRETMKYGMPLGSERFRSKIERVLGRKLGHSKPGRPAHGKDEILMVRDQEVLL